MKIALAVTAALLAQPALAAGYVNIWSTSFETGFFESVGPFPESSLSLAFGGGGLQSSGTFPGTGSRFLRNSTGGTSSFHGLAPLKWRGIASTDRVFFELCGAEVFERGMAPSRIVETINVSCTPRLSGPGVS
jgi:hypothetical protein